MYTARTRRGHSGVHGRVCTRPCIRPVNMAVYTVVCTAVYAAVYTVVHTYTVCVQRRVSNTAVYAACKYGRVHGRVRVYTAVCGPCTRGDDSVHGPYTAVCMAQYRRIEYGKAR